MFLRHEHRETQQYKRYRGQKMLGFTHAVVILGFSMSMKVYFLHGVLSQIRSTQPTDYPNSVLWLLDYPTFAGEVFNLASVKRHIDI